MERNATVRHAAVQPCGTPAAYERHRRRREPIDSACRAALAEYKRTRGGAAAAARRKLQAVRLNALERLAARHPAEFKAVFAEEMKYQA